MSGVHLHLLVNHVPILGAVFALILLLVAQFYGRAVLERTALALLVLVAVAGAAAKFSGEPAEDGVEGMPGVTREAIHEHEELADNAFIAAAIVGVASLVVLVRWRNTTLPRPVSYGALAGAAVVTGLMAYTGLLGGQIRHTEVRPGATAADATAIEAPRKDSAEPGER